MAGYESADKKTGDDAESTRSGGVAGAFSSLVSCFRKTKSGSESECDQSDDDEVPETLTGQREFSAVETNDAAMEEVAAISSPESAVVSAPEPAQVAAAAQLDGTPPAGSRSSPLDKPGVHTSAQKLISQNQQQPEQPRELDGRTQLVALAPEDGTAYFEQLIGKYLELQPGQVPAAVAVARDMANADYLGLIHQACGKDLDAFSRLLGLHRVMASNHCADWAEDMNLLRKGYGDAVLATVVSKYSVSECREILNSVYQQPVATAAAV